MAIEGPMLAVIALSLSLQNLCEYVGPNDARGWDYDCSGAEIRPPQPKPEQTPGQ